MPDVEVEGPDGKTYQFPDGTDKNSAIKYFKAKGIGVQPSAASPIAPPVVAKPKTSMQEVDITSGEPYKPLTEQFKDMASGAVKQAAQISAPGIAATIAKKLRPGAVSSLPVPHAKDIERSALSPEELTRNIEMAGSLPAVEGLAGGAELEAATAKTPRGRTVPPPPRDVPLDPVSQDKYTSALDKANKAHGEALAEHAVKEAEARAKWVDKAAGAKRSEAAVEAATNKKATLDRGSKEYTRLTHENLQQTYTAGRESLDNRWGQFRTATEGLDLDPARAFNTIEDAKSKFLKGSPSSLTQFNNLAKEMGIQQFMEGDGGELKAIPGTGKLPFDTARIHYSAIGDKLASGNLPGNVYQAMKQVSEGLDQQLTEASEQRGLGKEYQKLKGDEHQFRTDWKDSRSPLAKAYQAQDPNFLAGHLTGKGADLMMKQMARYREFGAKPYLPAAARRLSIESDAVDVPRVKPAPGKYEAPKTPELKPVERPKPDTKTSKIPRTVGRVAGKVVGGAIGSAAGHPFMGYAMGGEAGAELGERLAKRRTVPPPPSE